jgi:hypothetical protein
VPETLRKLLLADQHEVEEFLKDELLKIQQYVPKNCNGRGARVPSILSVTCLWPLPTNEINYLHLPLSPPSVTGGEWLCGVSWGL